MAKEKKFITCDGNEAAAHVSYMFSEVAAIYPCRNETFCPLTIWISTGYRKSSKIQNMFTFVKMLIPAC